MYLEFLNIIAQCFLSVAVCSSKA